MATYPQRRSCARRAATFELGKRREIIAQVARLIADDGQAVIPGEIEQMIRGDVEGGGSGPSGHFLLAHRVEDEQHARTLGGLGIRARRRGP